MTGPRPFGFGEEIPAAPRLPWEALNPGMARPAPGPGFAARLFSSGDPLEGGLLDPRRARGQGSKALMDAGLAILQGSGPQPFRQGLAQLLAGGLKAGQQSYQGSTERGIALDQVMQQREQQARLGALRAKYAGRSDITSQQQLLSELLTGGFTREADALAGFLSNAINQQGGGGVNAANITTHESADGTQLIAVDKTTGKEVWRQPLGEKSDDLSPYQKRLQDRSDRQFYATQKNGLRDDWNRRITPIRDTHETVLRALSLKDAAINGSGMARNQMIVAFVKAIDPGSVAREGEVTLAAQMVGLRDQAAGYIDAASGEVSPKIPLGLVKNIAATLEANERWFRKKWTEERNRYKEMAKDLGVDVSESLFDSPSPLNGSSSGQDTVNRILGRNP